jgi:kynurenine formamidase
VVLGQLLGALGDGSVEVIDLSHVLSGRTPMIALPPPFVNAPGWSLEELCAYDDRGPNWRWNAFHGTEHQGTHFDAPVHWVTGRGGRDVSQIPAAELIGPAVVIDRTREIAADPDYLLTRGDVEAFAAEHGPLPDGGWLLYRTGWSARAEDSAAFLNMDESGQPHWPGVETGCARWLAEETPVRGFGTEQVGTDAGLAHAFDPPFPCHHYMLGAGKFGLASLGNLERLPPTGAVLVPAPLRIEDGTGSPARVLALVERDDAQGSETTESEGR